MTITKSSLFRSCTVLKDGINFRRHHTSFKENTNRGNHQKDENKGSANKIFALSNRLEIPELVAGILAIRKSPARSLPKAAPC
jgi:hypothetical protein